MSHRRSNQGDVYSRKFVRADRDQFGPISTRVWTIQNTSKCSHIDEYIFIAFGWTVTMASAILEEGIMWDLAKDLDETAASIPFDKLCLSPARRIRWHSLVLFLALFFGPVVTVCGLSIAFLYQLRKRLKISRGLTSSTRAAMRSNSQVRRK